MAEKEGLSPEIKDIINLLLEKGANPEAKQAVLFHFQILFAFAQRKFQGVSVLSYATSLEELPEVVELVKAPPPPFDPGVPVGPTLEEIWDQQVSLPSPSLPCVLPLLTRTLGHDPSGQRQIGTKSVVFRNHM
jgi:hypothetical protein